MGKVIVTRHRGTPAPEQARDLIEVVQISLPNQRAREIMSQLMSGNVTSTTSIHSDKPKLNVLIVCLWFALCLPLLEALFYLRAPAPRAPDAHWFTILVSVALFALIGGVLIICQIALTRFKAVATSFFLCCWIVALDCGSLIFHNRIAALALVGAAAATVTTAAWSKFGSRIGFFSRTLPVLAIYAIGYLCWLPVTEHQREKHALAHLLPANSQNLNVVVIIVDALRADHLSAYGYSRPTSPNLDRISQQGVLFENAVAPSSWTLPSHASMLTGRYPTEHNAGEDAPYLDARYPTLAGAFAQLGYRTAGFSGNPFLFTRQAGLARGFSHFEDGSYLEKLIETNLGFHIHNVFVRLHLIHDVVGRQDASEINRNALHWIDRGTAPFLVVMNYFDVHEPFVPPRGFRQQFSHAAKPLDQMNLGSEPHLGTQQVQQEVDAYDDCISYVDLQIASLMEQLAERGLAQNTLVVITSDHGESFNEHGLMFHGKALYWELIHVPLLFVQPGHVPAAKRIATPVAVQDLPATLLSLAAPNQNALRIPGASLAGLWRNEGDGPLWSHPISELAAMGDSPAFPSYYGRIQSVVAQGWHLIEDGIPSPELYACCSDRAEVNNVATSPGGKSIATALHAEVTLRSLEPKPAAPNLAAPSETDSERNKINDNLRSLGYVP